MLVIVHKSMMMMMINRFSNSVCMCMCVLYMSINEEQYEQIVVFFFRTYVGNRLLFRIDRKCADTSFIDIEQREKNRCLKEHQKQLQLECIFLLNPLTHTHTYIH